MPVMPEAEARSAARHLVCPFCGSQEVEVLERNRDDLPQGAYTMGWSVRCRCSNANCKSAWMYFFPD